MRIIIKLIKNLNKNHHPNNKKMINNLPMI